MESYRIGIIILGEILVGNSGGIMWLNHMIDAFGVDLEN